MLSSLLYPPSRPDTERLRTAVGGKTVLLTGASFGIGEALAAKLAAAGARLLLVARSADKLAEVQTRLTAAGAQAEYFAADLRDAAQCEAVARWTEENGGADILVLNAGHSIRRCLWQSLDRFHDVERCMSLNFYAPARLTLALLPELARRQHRCRIGGECPLSGRTRLGGLSGLENRPHAMVRQHRTRGGRTRRVGGGCTVAAGPHPHD